MIYATNPASTTLELVTLLPRSSREFGCFWKKFFGLTLQQTRRQRESERERTGEKERDRQTKSINKLITEDNRTLCSSHSS